MEIIRNHGCRTKGKIGGLHDPSILSSNRHVPGQDGHEGLVAAKVYGEAKARKRRYGKGVLPDGETACRESIR
ncbi:MAG: hypothetical protein ACI8W8_001950 [Rhodothermales bacterium]|jgi:hypothetical protein